MQWLVYALGASEHLGTKSVCILWKFVKCFEVFHWQNLLCKIQSFNVYIVCGLITLSAKLLSGDVIFNKAECNG